MIRAEFTFSSGINPYRGRIFYINEAYLKVFVSNSLLNNKPILNHFSNFRVIDLIHVSTFLVTFVASKIPINIF